MLILGPTPIDDCPNLAHLELEDVPPSYESVVAGAAAGANVPHAKNHPIDLTLHANSLC